MATLGHNSTVWSVCFNFDGKKFVSCDNDRKLKVWASELLTFFVIYSSERYWISRFSIKKYHTKSIFSNTWSYLGLIMSASGDRGIRIFIKEYENLNSKNKINILRLAIIL